MILGSSFRVVPLLVALLVLRGQIALSQQQPAPAPAAQPGRIVGRLIDKDTGRPIASARVSILGQQAWVETNLDGRYRTQPIAPGTYSVRAFFIGYKSAQRDSVRVLANQTATADFVMEQTPFELEEIVVVTQATDRAATEAGMLAMQQAAPTVMDGISAETISRSPDSDAGEAITRVTGASVVGDKFVYVRGLGERYGNTLLNGVELPSPEPLKKVVPLDLFPSSLLESIITTKAGRPDRPGDVTGAGVEITTKEFPENPVLQMSVSTEYNSVASFETVALGPRSLGDRLGFDGSGRTPSGRFPIPTDGGVDFERFAESLRGVWTPSGEAPLNYGLGLNMGGLIASGDNPLGGVFAINYGSKTEFVPERLSRLVRTTDPAELPVQEYRYRQTTAVVDWGAVLNFTRRLGGSGKISWRNLYSRNAEELFLDYRGINRDATQTDNSHGYQVQYIKRDLFQTQLAGDHLIAPILNSRIEWKTSFAVAHRDEPENRTLLYTVNPDGSESFINGLANFFFFRFLNDRILTGQLDWAIPLSLRNSHDTEFKVGVMYRRKRRDFQASSYALQTSDTFDPTVLGLPPERLFSPEILGSELVMFRNNGPGLNGAGVDPSYKWMDDLYAGYLMLDVIPVPRVRLVGGVRVEDWRLRLDNSGQGATSVVRNNLDPLWSANLTLSLSDRMNIRASAFRSVARPEARELSLGYYVPVAGECGYYGNDQLLRSSIYNGDVRWEWFPAAGEIVSLTGFFKHFDKPIFEQIGFSTATSCNIRYFNAEQARNYGLELEFRKGLGFLAGGLRNVSLGANFTYVSSEAIDRFENATIGTIERRREFVGQSPYLVNLSLRYDDYDSGLNGSVLLNYYDDRILRYGETTVATGGPTPEVISIPDIIEKGRATLDAKLSKRFGAMTFSLSGKNLLDQPVTIFQPLDGTELLAGRYQPGVSVGIGVGYDF